MLYFISFFAEIIILYLLSRAVSKNLSKFMSIGALSFLFLPGIIIHELSHLFMAAILFVPVGDMEFVPKRAGNSVKMGSVEIGKTDPVRRSIIGFAPVFLGLVIVIGVIYLSFSTILFFQNKNIFIFVAIILTIIYLLFAISNTMFSSRRDMEGTIEIAITLLIIFLVAYILGFRFTLSYLDKIPIKEFIAIIRQSAMFLMIPIAIDLLILGTLGIFRKNRD